MPVYSYRAKSDAGKMIDGELKADSIDAIKLHLKEKGYTPIEVSEKKSSYLSLFQPRVGLKDLSIFCRQFAIILQAGVPIATALDVLRSQANNPSLKTILNDIFENMQKGVPLSTSMKQHKSAFPELLINMVEAGEITGQLEEVFSRMALTYEKDLKLQNKIKGSLTYPIVIMIVAIGVIMVLMIKVVPSFMDILKNFKVEMPMITLALISVSKFFQDYWIFMLLGAVGVGFAIRAALRTETGKDFVHEVVLKTPVIGSLVTKIITARFTRTLSVLLASGVLLIQSMDVVQKIIGNSVVQKKLDEVISEIKKGRGLYVPLLNIKFFPPMVLSMIKIGEESGDLDFALNKCADFYDEEVEVGLQSATALIEPIVMIVLSAVVGFIVLSVLFPMFSIYENLSK